MRTVASTANYNNEIGVPLTLCRIERGTEAVVCELGMRGAGQIAYLTDIAAPDVGVITSVGPVHLELMGTVEAVAAAKAEILELKPGAVAVVPYAEPLLEPHLAGRDGRVVTFGEADGADVRLVSIGGGRAEIVHRGRTLTVPVSFEQRHNGVNLAAAVAACDALGADIDDSLLAGAATGRDLALARRAAAAPGRRRPHRRLLQRQPGLDERGAARPRLGRRRPPYRRRARRHGRARRGPPRATTRRSRT